MVFDDDPKSYVYVRVPRWRIELNRIINHPCPTDKERLFLVCFLYEQLKWHESSIIRFIERYNKWTQNNSHGRGKFNSEITTRQVNIICERIRNGELGIGFRSQSYNSSQGETHEGETQTWGSLGKFETCASHTKENNENSSHGLSFGVSTYELRTNEMEVCDIQEKQVYAKINDGSRWYKVSEKTGQYGNFNSIDSGPLMEVTLENGTTQLGFGKPDRFFSLPKEPEVLQQLIDGLLKLVPTKEPVNVDKKKK